MGSGHDPEAPPRAWDDVGGGSGPGGHGHCMSQPFFATPAEVVGFYKVDPTVGLSDAEVERRRHAFGRNALKGHKSIHPVVLFLKHLVNVMSAILFLALGLSLAVREWVEAGVLGFVIVANAVVGFIQEYGSEKTMQALRRLSSPLARVLRGGHIVELPADELVPGDVIHLEEGDQVPADVRLLRTVAFAVEEAILTGESVAVTKHPRELPARAKPAAAVAAPPLGDRKNMAFFGCLASKGRAVAVVTATGMGTELGRIAKSIGERPAAKTALQQQLERLGMGLFLFAMVLGVVVFAVNRFQFRHEILLYVISMAVALIPEGLLPVVTVAMAVGVRRMARARTIVRKLTALEALGTVTDICSDKTGTLTLSRMVVTALWLPPDTTLTVTGHGLNPEGDLIAAGTGARVDPAAGGGGGLADLLTVAALCNTATLAREGEEWVGVGDATEVALAVLAAKTGFGKERLLGPSTNGNGNGNGSGWFSLVTEFPFDSTIKRMSMVVADRQGGPALLLTKGAFESLLPLCTHIRTPTGGDVPLDPTADTARLRAHVETLAKSGLRVLALATRVLGPEEAEAATAEQRAEVERGLVFLGLAGLKDPPRPETLPAVRSCRTAGITVRMVTGDHVGTAAAIARQVEILSPADGNAAAAFITTAPVFDVLSSEELDALPRLPRVVARCAPHTKVTLVKALHRRGKVVAMTGDGVNDAPALKRADVGIAMGKNGSDVTKQAADIVITDDNFATIAQAIEEGRRIGANIVKFVCHLMTGNVAETLALMLGLVFLDADNLSVYPLSTLQILWINMVTSSPPALGLACEPAEPDVMEDPPVEKGRLLINRPLFIDTLYYGTIIAALSLANFAVVAFLDGPGVAHTRNCNYELTPECEHIFRARGATFACMTLLLLIHAFNCKDLHRSLRRMRYADNPALIGAVMLGVATLCPTFYIPVVYTDVFYQAPLDWEWGLILGSCVFFLIAAEAYKAWLRPSVVAWERRAVAERRETRRHQRVVNSQGLELVVVPSAEEPPRKGAPAADGDGGEKNGSAEVVVVDVEEGDE